MRPAQDKPLKEIIDILLDKYKLRKGLLEVRLLQVWEKLFGSFVFNQTQKIRLQNGVLYVEVKKAELAQELSMGNQLIIKSINTELGNEVVQKIVFKTAPYTQNAKFNLPKDDKRQ